MTDEAASPIEGEIVIDSDSAPEEEAQTPVEEEAQQVETEEASTEQAQEGDEQGNDPEWYTKAINRQHFKYREEERKRLELEQELEKIKGQLPKQAAPDIPPPPDPFAEDYEQKIAERDKAIQERIRYDTQQSLIKEAARRKAVAEQEAAQKEFTARVQTYSDRAEKLGVEAQELAVAGQTIASYGIPDALTNYILNEEKGPLITMHLARHPQELEQVRSLDPVSAAVHIATQIAPKVSVVPNKSQAPKPPETLSGAGAPPIEDGPEGATYE